MKQSRYLLLGGLLIWALSATSLIAEGHGSAYPLVEIDVTPSPSSEDGSLLSYSSSAAARWSPMSMPVGVYEQIGNRDSIYQVAFDYDVRSNHLFAVLLFEGDGSESKWTVNFSDDGGRTWQETYTWSASYRINDIAAAVVAGNLYVALPYPATQDNLLLYRFNCETGQRQNFGNGSVFTVVGSVSAPEHYEEVVMVGNDDMTWIYKRFVFCTAITSAGKLKYNYADSTGLNWTDDETSVTNAWRGLAMSTNPGMNIGPHILASYYDTQARVRLVYTNAYRELQTSPAPIVYINNSYPVVTDVAAQQDSIVVAFEEVDPEDNQLQVKILVSTDGGGSWGVAPVEAPIVADWWHRPAVSSRHGGGLGMIYRYDGLGHQDRFAWGGFPANTSYQKAYLVRYVGAVQPDLEQYNEQTYGAVTVVSSNPYYGAYYSGFSRCCHGNAGDVATDGAVNVSDLTFLVAFLFQGGAEPTCDAQADVNGDLNVNVSDLTYIVNFLFNGGPSPSPC